VTEFRGSRIRRRSAPYIVAGTGYHSGFQTEKSPYRRLVDEVLGRNPMGHWCPEAETRCHGTNQAPWGQGANHPGRSSVNKGVGTSAHEITQRGIG
jgi:hypothetical protein